MFYFKDDNNRTRRAVHIEIMGLHFDREDLHETLPAYITWRGYAINTKTQSATVGAGAEAFRVKDLETAGLLLSLMRCDNMLFLFGGKDFKSNERIDDLLLASEDGSTVYGAWVTAYDDEGRKQAKRIFVPMERSIKEPRRRNLKLDD